MSFFHEQIFPFFRVENQDTDYDVVFSTHTSLPRKHPRNGVEYIKVFFSTIFHIHRDAIFRPAERTVNGKSGANLEWDNRKYTQIPIPAAGSLVSVCSLIQENNKNNENAGEKRF